jgi:hypothetical protein
LRGSIERCCAEVRECSMEHGSPMNGSSTWIVTPSKMSDSESQRIQDLQLPALCNQRVAVWCVLSSVRIFGLVFIDGTVTSEVYLRLLSDEFVIFLLGYDNSINSDRFQQDGARPQTIS